MNVGLSRRSFLRGLGTVAVGTAIAACQPQTIIVKEAVKETVIVEGTPKVIEKVVTQIVAGTPIIETVIEKEVTKIVEIEVIVTATPVKVVTATPTVEKSAKKVVEQLSPPPPVVLRTLGDPGQRAWEASEYERFEQLTGIAVQSTTVPYREHREKLLADFAAGGGAFDVFPIDSIEVAEYAAAGWALDVTERVTPEMKVDILPFASESMTYQDKWYGLPLVSEWKSTVYNRAKFSTAGFDGLGTAFDDFVTQCQALQEAGLAKYGASWSWSQGECLVCDFSALAACWGGELFNQADEPTFNVGGAVDALQWMVDSIYRYEIADPASLTFTEGEVESDMRAGKIGFSFQWGLPLVPLNDPEVSGVVGECALALSPSLDGKHPACVSGTRGLSISAFSKHPREAWQLLNFRAGFEGAKRNAIGAGITPGWGSLFTDPDIAATVPGLNLMLEQARTVVNRPCVPWYRELSAALQEELHSALIRRKTPQEALDDAYKRTLRVKAEWEARTQFDKVSKAC
jgi:multiple sugar transport system substrate-binding protein